MKTEKLALQLRTIAEAYAEKQGADSYFYQDKAVAYNQITLNDLMLEFVYTLKGGGYCPVSTLSCRVYLDNNSPCFFEIQELIDYLDIYDYHCYCFPYIENEKRLKACFDYITDFIEYHRDEITVLCSSKEELEAEKIKEINRVADINGSELTQKNAANDKAMRKYFEQYSAFITGRYTSEPAYVAFVNCEYEKSLSLYEKFEEKTGYEEKLVEFINERYAPYEAVPFECASIVDVQKYTSTDTLSFILMITISVVFFCLIFLVIQAVINLIFINSTTVAKCQNPLQTMLFGIIPGAVGAIAFRKYFEPLTKPNKRKAFEFYDLLHDSADEKRVRYISYVVLAVTAIVFLLFCRPSFIMYDDYMLVKKTTTPIVTYDTYHFDDITEVVYVKGYYTDSDFTEYVESPSYALINENGGYLDTRRLGLNEYELQVLVKRSRPTLEDYSMRYVYSVDEL